jgi:hypothetical protein
MMSFSNTGCKDRGDTLIRTVAVNLNPPLPASRKSGAENRGMAAGAAFRLSPIPC